MRITLINQTFYPDVASSGQHLKDLAVALAKRGHDVTVVASRRAYDSPQTLFPRREKWQDIQIHRVANTGFGKRAKWRRIADFATFIGACCWKLACLPKPDVVVAMTSPPIISFIGAIFARIRGARLCYWVMDLNPDEAIAAGWLNPESFITKTLEHLSQFSLRTASKIIVLDEFMRQRILNKGISKEKISVVPPWSHDADVFFDTRGRSQFRQEHNLTNKFVVMYAGNHSPCHPLDTVLAAANKLSSHPDLIFLFVGGGSEFSRVKQFAENNALKNILCLPYQPIKRLAGSLSAADLHLVIMGDPFVGMVHPCKIYNILRIGSPLLYIGPTPSHITEILSTLNQKQWWATATHGSVEAVMHHILRLKQSNGSLIANEVTEVSAQFSAEQLLPRLVQSLEDISPPVLPNVMKTSNHRST